VRRPGGPGETGSERESGHAPPWQRLDRVAGRRERVGVLAIAEGPQDVGPRPAGGQRRQAGGCELEPGLVAWAGDAEPVVVGLEQAGNVSIARELARHPGQRRRVNVVIIVDQRLAAVGRDLPSITAMAQDRAGDGKRGDAQRVLGLAVPQRDEPGDGAKRSSAVVETPGERSTTSSLR